MRKIIYLCLVICLSGCGIFKKNTKNKLVDKTETTTKQVTKTAELITDKSKITINERADSSIYTKPQQSVGTNKIGFHIDSLVYGLTAISNNLIDVKLSLDSNGVLTTTALIKPQRVDFKIDRTTEINKDITANKSGQVDQKINEQKDIKIVDSTSEPTGVGMLGVIVIVAVACLFLWIISKR